jgi:hypothetical protein
MGALDFDWCWLLGNRRQYRGQSLPRNKRKLNGWTHMLTGAHSIIYSRNADADRAFLRDVLGLPNVDAGDGWLIFGLPPAEVAVHRPTRTTCTSSI